MNKLPAYSYVPGMFPHPIRDPAGHSYGRSEPTSTLSNACQWRECPVYLHGIELFSAGYYWEAHEAWEAVWNAFKRQGIAADFCKSLIKLAAAGVKAREGRPIGVARHAKRAQELLSEVAERLENDANAIQENEDRITEPTTVFMGLNITSLKDLADQLAATPSEFVNQSEQSVVRVMPVNLVINCGDDRPKSE